MPAIAPPAPKTSSPDGSIVVLGDTQRTTFTERFFCGREQNEEARLELIEKLAAEERPAFVVHLGDMVAFGASASSWEYFDRLMSPLRARGIEIRPLLGNHDYWGDDRAARRHVRRRFPDAARGAYWKQHRDLGLIWLNSNLSGSLGRDQAEWFEGTLRRFQEDRATRAILVFTHHPPYTNGVGREGSEYVRDELVPRFFRYSKTVAMMSGHVHGYERFQAKGRTFVVTGGGGGPRVEYELGSAAEPPPAYHAPDEKRRAFNYVVIDHRGDHLEFTTKCLAIDAVCIGGKLDDFGIPLAHGP
jgi:hypothetical protein